MKQVTVTALTFLLSVNYIQSFSSHRRSIRQSSNVRVGTNEEVLSEKLEQFDFVDRPSSSTAVGSRASRTSSSVPEKVQMVIDERAEFEMNLGKAVDTLKKDYPKILTEEMDFSIYDDDLVVVDPSGVTLHGIKTYKTSFKFLHTVVNFFYSAEASGITFRLVYDWARNNVRISWNAVLVPKPIYGGVRNKLFVDGISVYEVDRGTGKICKHTIESLVVNDSPVRAPQGVIYGLANEIVNPQGTGGIPVLSVAGGKGGKMQVGMDDVLKIGSMGKKESYVGALYSLSETSSRASASDDAFESKNMARKKFGLPPLSREEFEALEALVKEQSASVKETQKQLAAQLAREEERKKRKAGNFFTNALKDECVENWDCERPYVCCDLIFKKICCNNGVGIPSRIPNGKAAEIPVTDGYPEGEVFDDRY
mmetsp:Transcript_12743/g.19235  ORF Transcript_12743/g.19235 Transcript_12743/m.19235 type:complete len:424 (-) Transcript_12743:96-1367(-)